MSTVKLQPLVGYVGGKRRFASAIADALLTHRPDRIFDLGCGSGAVSLELVNRGFPKSRVVMADIGPWGWVWRAVGQGTLSLHSLKTVFVQIAEMDPRTVAQFVEQEIAALPPSPESFLVLQAASFGATPVWWDGSSWRRGEGERKYKARGYWEPSRGSRETKPRGTIFDPVKTYSRIEAAALRLKGIDARHERAEDTIESCRDGDVVYVDPPYEGFSGYGEVLDVDYILQNARSRVYVSEGKCLSGCDSARHFTQRKAASLNGKSGAESNREEWLCLFDRRDRIQCMNPDCRDSATYHDHARQA